MITTLIILLIIYILSIFGTFRWIRVSHSKGGTHEELDADVQDIFIIFIPVVNTVLSLTKAKKRTININNFFKIKK